MSHDKSITAPGITIDATFANGPIKGGRLQLDATAWQEGSAITVTFNGKWVYRTVVKWKRKMRAVCFRFVGMRTES